MKWLFAVLVALNVIVFGTVMGIHVGRKSEAGKGAVTQAAHELSVPAGALAAKRAEAPPAWIKSGDNAEAKEPTVDDTHIPQEKTEAEKAEKERLAREKKQREEKLKKAAEEKARKAREASGLAEDGSAAAPSAAQYVRCTRTASVTVPEDDYHRIKGLLVQWPHAASRRVEQREGAEGAGVRYAVSVQGDAAELLGRMSEKGFGGTVGSGGILAGTFDNRSSAQALLSRLEGAGFNAQIREQASGGSGMSVAKMQVFFTGLSEADIQSVQNVVGKYGKLRRGNCR